MGNHDHAILDSDTNQGNKTNRRGNIQCHSPHIQRQHTTKQSQGNDTHHQSRLPDFTASRKQQKQHQSQRQRNHSPQTGIRTMLVLELSGPFQMHGIMIVFHLFINQRIRLIQERRQVHAT